MAWVGGKILPAPPLRDPPLEGGFWPEWPGRGGGKGGLAGKPDQIRGVNETRLQCEMMTHVQCEMMMREREKRSDVNGV